MAIKELDDIWSEMDPPGVALAARRGDEKKQKAVVRQPAKKVPLQKRYKMPPAPPEGWGCERCRARAEGRTYRSGPHTRQASGSKRCAFPDDSEADATFFDCMEETEKVEGEKEE